MQVDRVSGNPPTPTLSPNGERERTETAALLTANTLQSRTKAAGGPPLHPEHAPARGQFDICGEAYRPACALSAARSASLRKVMTPIWLVR